MTFGEHLEELRRSLGKALIWLAVGLGIGLYFADGVVQYIQEPLKEAITEFYVDQSLHEMGFEVGDEVVNPDRALLLEMGMVRERVYVLDQKESPLLGTAEAAADPNAPSEPEPDGAEPAEGDGAEPGDAEETDTTSLSPPPLSVKGGTAPIGTDNAAESDEPVELSFGTLRPTSIFRRIDSGLRSLKMEEPFMIWLKAGLVIGAVIGSPGIFYHLWSFVAAGLYPHERRYVHIYLPFSILLFWLGVATAFYFVLQFVLQFLLAFNAHLNVEATPQLTYYVNFVLLLPLGFGIAFQLPLVMLFLQRIGLFETQAYINSWRVAILVIFFISMILTPADIYSMIGLAVPLTGLYFLGIVLCKFMPRGTGIGSQGYDP